MIVFELPATRDGGDILGVSLGSCRVRNPLIVLRDRGDLRILAEGPTPTHTAAEALQSLAVVLGERHIPDIYHPYIYESDHRPSADRLASALRYDIDVFVLEVSDDKQFSHGDVCLNQNLVTRNLVQAHRGALLDWYREICRGRGVAEETVQAALGRLRESGYRHDAPMADLLRGIKLELRGGDETIEKIATLTKKMGGQWVIVGLFCVEGDEGDVMKRRRTLNEALRDAAARCGALFFDPSQLVDRHGRAAVLDAGGANVYEYAETFYPTVGETLVGLVRSVGPKRSSARSAAPQPKRKTPALASLGRSGWVMRTEANAARLFKPTRRLIRKIGRWAARRLG